MSRERDTLHGQLDESAVEVQNLRRKLEDTALKAEQGEAAVSRSVPFLPLDGLFTQSGKLSRDTTHKKYRIGPIFVCRVVRHKMT
jgi:hypothetical protein